MWFSKDLEYKKFGQAIFLVRTNLMNTEPEYTLKRIDNKDQSFALFIY